jgi:hypothetical protein
MKTKIKTNEIPNCTVTIIYQVQSYDHYDALYDFRNHHNSGKEDRIEDRVDILINSLSDPSIIIKQFMSWKYEPEKTIKYEGLSIEQDDGKYMIKLNNDLDKTFLSQEIFISEEKLYEELERDSKFYKFEKYKENDGNDVYRDREFIPIRIIVRVNKFRINKFRSALI